MTRLGDAARHLREIRGLSQKSAAALLGISNVYLCNIEANKAVPSQVILDRYRELWNVDLHVIAWCMFGDVQRLPPRVRQAAEKLAAAWKRELGAVAELGCEAHLGLRLASEEASGSA